MIGTIASIISAAGAAGSLATTIHGMMSGGGASDKAKAKWGQRIGAMNEFGSENIYMPWAQGMWAPYAVHGRKGQRSYNYQPSSTLKNVYSNYLNRQYGMPNSISSSIVSRAMRQVAPSAKKIPQTPAAAGAMSQISPKKFAKSVLQTQTPEVHEQLDYLKGAGELAKLNLQKVQSFSRILEK